MLNFKKQTNELAELLTFKRPAYSKSEDQFIAKYIDSIPGIKKDGFENRYIKIGNGKTMISVHTDTVHNQDGMQTIIIDPIKNHICLDTDKENRKQKIFSRSKKEKNVFFPSGQCLGSDDGTGIYIALAMIHYKIPALYVFHRCEETGGQGSEYFSRHNINLFDKIDRCIALDRKGTNDIITHQFSGRCCSDKFANDLADLLGMEHKGDNTGSFTDSANYTDVIPECTNLSVGYYLQHSSREYQDCNYLSTLIDRLCTVDLESLSVYRDPSDINSSFDDHDWTYNDVADLVYDKPEKAIKLLFNSLNNIDSNNNDTLYDNYDYADNWTNQIDQDWPEPGHYCRGKNR